MKKREKEGDTGRKGEEYGGEIEKKKGERNRERREEVEGEEEIKREGGRQRRQKTEGEGGDTDVITLVCLPLTAEILEVWL